MSWTMFLVFLYCCACCCAIDVVSSSNDVSDGCFTPDQKVGQCIELRKCDYLISLLQHEPLTTAITNFLKQSQCGFEGLQPKVCCAINDKMSFAYSKPPPNEKLSNLLPDTNTCGLHEYYILASSAQASLKEFPWLALLEYKKPNGRGFHCGGTLISKRYVLTAAHCVSLFPDDWDLVSVRLGEYNLNSTTDCYNDPYNPTSEKCADPPLNVAVSEKIVHEHYDPEDHLQFNDIAILRLSKDVSFTEFIRPICLPTTSDFVNGNSGDKMTVAGWGLLGESGSHSTVKLKSRVPLKPYDDCSSVYDTLHVSLQDQLCTEAQNSCTADSGGPLMIHNASATGFNWYLAGVKSFGPTPCGNHNWPDVYTNVSNYVSWILTHLKS